MPLSHLTSEYFNVNFANDPQKPHYFIEKSDFDNCYHRASFIAHTYLLTLHKCRKTCHEPDKPITNILRHLTKLISSSFFQHRSRIKYRANPDSHSLLNAMAAPSAFDVLLDLEKEYNSRTVLNNDFNFWQESPNAVKNANCFVHYGFLYSRRNGKASMAVPGGKNSRMNNFIRYSAYLILLKHLLPSLNFYLFEIVIYYLFAINRVLDNIKVNFAHRINLPYILSLSEYCAIAIAKKINNREAEKMERFKTSHIQPDEAEARLAKCGKIV
ncbi:MAG: hypothetical protein ABH896_01885 [Candidatus Jacksonbacteria bacterium]